MKTKTNSLPRIRNGGRLPFSPISLVQRDAPKQLDHVETETYNQTKTDRVLDSNDDFTSYLVDEDGNEYEPYSLAWRYLGMYIDCDIDNENDDDDDDDDEERRLDSGDGDCERVLLWAAVSRYEKHRACEICISIMRETELTNTPLLLFAII